MEASWDGDYMAASGQTVSIQTAEDGKTFTFQFNDDGVAGTAQISGTAASFSGDDGYAISFSLDGDSLDVAVSGGSTDDETSAMTGTYTRQ